MRELALHILDVLQNAREAGATRVELTVEEDPKEDRLVIEVRDNGKGMDRQTVRNVLDPFFTTRKTRHVGLGLPLFAAAAEQCGGGLQIDSEPGRGTTVRAVFQLGHIDRAPLGDVAATILAFLLGEPPCDLVYARRRGDRRFRLDTRELRRELDPVPLSHPAVREWLKSYIEEGEQAVRGSAAESP